MLEPQDFKNSDLHPYGMLKGYSNASEKESLLAWMLSQCIKAGDWVAIPCKYSHDALVSDGLLLETEQARCYRLSEKAKGYLYAFYSKEL